MDSNIDVYYISTVQTSRKCLPAPEDALPHAWLVQTTCTALQARADAARGVACEHARPRTRGACLRVTVYPEVLLSTPAET